MTEVGRDQESPPVKDGSPKKQKGLTVLGLISIMLTMMVGTGILALPNTVGQAGWLPSIILFVVGAFLSYHCCMIYGKVLDMTTVLEPNEKAFAVEQTAKIVGGRWFEITAAFIQYFDMWMTSGNLLMAMAESTNEAFREYLHSTADLYRPLVAIFGAFIFPLCIAKSTHFLSKAAHVGVAATAVMFVAIVVNVIMQMKDGAEEHAVVVPDGNSTRSIPVRHETSGDFRQILMAFNVIMYSYAVSEMMPTVYADMERPRLFSVGVGVSHVTTFAIYVGVCSLAFVAYGSAAGAKGIDTITTIMNNKGCKIAVSISLIIHIFVDIPVWLNPVSIAIERRIQKRVAKERHFLVQVLVRGCVVLATIGFGMIGQQVVNLQALSGAVTTNFTCVLFPNVFFLLTKFKIRKLDEKMREAGTPHVTTNWSLQNLPSRDPTHKHLPYMEDSQSDKDGDDQTSVEEIGDKDPSKPLVGSSKSTTNFRPEEISRAQPSGYVDGTFSWFEIISVSVATAIGLVMLGAGTYAAIYNLAHS